MIEFLASIRRAFQAHGHRWFSGGSYDLNLVGIRSPCREADNYDDLLVCAYEVDGVPRVHAWPWTTHPGSHYLRNLINPADGGAAILVPGQYRGAYKRGLHRGRPALVQCAPVRVWRDGNQDNVLDWGEDEGIEGWYGINIHDPKGPSAGCQVSSTTYEMMALLEVYDIAARRWGNRVTYTLITTADLS